MSKALVFFFKFISRYATILAFDVKVERDAQELADSLGVKIFQADIIYHLFDKFTAYREEIKQQKRDEFKSIAVFPCKMKVSILYLPQIILLIKLCLCLFSVSFDAGKNLKKCCQSHNCITIHLY